MKTLWREMQAIFLTMFMIVPFFGCTSTDENAGSENEKMDLDSSGEIEATEDMALDEAEATGEDMEEAEAEPMEQAIEEEEEIVDTTVTEPQGNAQTEAYMALEKATTKQPTASAQPQPSADNRVFYVMVEKATIRATPAKNGKSVGHFEKGDHFLAQPEGEWVKIADGKWVALKQLSEKPTGRKFVKKWQTQEEESTSKAAAPTP